MLSERLKEETHKAHIEVEKLIIPRLKKLDSNCSYAQLLNVFYGYFNPVEQQIEQQIGADILFDIEERRKSASLLNDLQSLGTIRRPNSCNDLPKIETVVDALGAMYVLEGSTLGGQFISKMIAEKLGLTSENGISFFSGYGAETSSKWSNFKDLIDNYSGDQTAEDEVIKAANETFTKFKTWIELN